MPFIYEARRVETVEPVQVATNMTYDVAEPADVPVMVKIQEEGQVPVLSPSGDRPRQDSACPLL